ncbi:MAG: tetraacyldisaccharide 4'-kinase [Elusimicrobiota bacterium]|jgi:tetraacyldisaccharide 4'-kinase|nr:tetraacyldisaccharide 4'-kinase [Elusimicrobiota bacterium]
MKFLLFVLSLIYSKIQLLDKIFTRSKKLTKPVISVGNITWGGTGKTPIVIEIAKFFVSQGKKPVILTRGYGRKFKKPVLLKNGGQNIAVFQSGDEAMLIAKSVPQADVIVGAKRYKNALFFEKETTPDVYILDDGFQHWKIKRNVDIVCINGANPFGNDMLLPAGILREYPKKALKRASTIVITNSDFAKDLPLLESKILAYSGVFPTSVYYGNYKFKTLNLKDDFDIKKFKNTKVYSLCAIGFSQGFKNSLKKTGVKTQKSFNLKDHKSYTKKDIEKIFNEIGDGSFLVITAKDAVKIDVIIDDQLKSQIAVLTLSPIFKDNFLESNLSLDILQNT